MAWLGDLALQSQDEHDFAVAWMLGSARLLGLITWLLQVLLNSTDHFLSRPKALVTLATLRLTKNATQRFSYFSTYIQVQKTKTKQKEKKWFLNNSMILFDQVSLNGAPHKACFWSNFTFLLKIPCKLILLSLSSYKKTLSSSVG